MKPTATAGWPPRAAEDWGLTPMQLFMLTVVLIGPTAVATLPSLIIRLAGQGAWLAVLIALPAGLVPPLLLYAIDRRLPGLTLIEQARAAAGPYLGLALAILALVDVASITPVILREIAGLVGAEALPRTPRFVVLALVLWPSIYALRQGPEVIARLAEVLVPVVVVAVCGLLIVALRSVETINLLPPVSGSHPLLQAVGALLPWYTETWLLGFLLPFRGRDRGAALRATAAGVGLVGALLCLTVVWSLGIFGPLAGHLTNALFQITRVSSIAQFLSHLDALLVVVWMASGFAKLAVWLYVLCLGLSQVLGLRDYRPLTLPVGACVLIAGGAWFESSSQLALFDSQLLPFWVLLHVGVPLLVWLAALWHGRRCGTAAAPPGG